MAVPRRQPVPLLWLFTDERLGDDLWPALERLPRCSGVIFRHHATAPADRRKLFARIGRIARRRGLILLRAGEQPLRGEMGVHGMAKKRPGSLRTVSAHSRAEAVAGHRAGAAALFASPVYATRSHPGAAPSGPRRAALIGRGMKLSLIALGGVDARSFKQLVALGFDGWAAIDAWRRRDPHQKRKAVPI